MSINNDAVKEMAKAIIIAAKQIVKKAKFDKTFKGRVTAMLGDNKYIITVNGKEYTVTCPYTLAFQEIVHVTALENDFNNLVVVPSKLKLLSNNDLVNNTATNDTTKPVSSAVTYAMNQTMTTMNTSLTTLNNNLTYSTESFSNDNFVGHVVKSGGSLLLYLQRTNIELTNGTTYDVVTLPQTYWPKSSQTRMIPCSSAGIMTYITISSSGVVTLRPYSNITAATGLYVGLSYLN